MLKMQEQYVYFERLEKTVKTGLAIYVTALIVGCFTACMGVDNLLLHWSSSDWMIVGAELVIVASLYSVLYYAAGKIHWLGELHIRLDKKFFGFLVKSNDVIYRTLVSTLHNDDQLRFHSLSESRKTSLTETIFSKLSEDSQLFDALLKSNIFSAWIKYWVTMYGSLTFLSLSFVSLIAGWFLSDTGGKVFFGIIWGLAMFHLIMSCILGRLLLKKTESSVQQMLETHKEEITLKLEESLAAQAV